MNFWEFWKINFWELLPIISLKRSGQCCKIESSAECEKYRMCPSALPIDERLLHFMTNSFLLPLVLHALFRSQKKALKQYGFVFFFFSLPQYPSQLALLENTEKKIKTLEKQMHLRYSMVLGHISRNCSTEQWSKILRQFFQIEFHVICSFHADGYTQSSIPPRRTGHSSKLAGVQEESGQHTYTYGLIFG